MLLPTKMEMCKITAYAQNKRDIIRAIHKAGQIEIYDMQERTRLAVRSDERKTVSEYISRIDQLLDFLQPKTKNPKPQHVDEEELTTIFCLILLKTRLFHSNTFMISGFENLNFHCETPAHSISVISFRALCTN